MHMGNEAFIYMYECILNLWIFLSGAGDAAVRRRELSQWLGNHCRYTAIFFKNLLKVESVTDYILAKILF